MSIFQHHFSNFPIAWNNKDYFNTPSILISIRQRLLKPPDLLRRNPQTPPDPGRLEIALVQETVDGPPGNAKIDSNLVQAIIALQGRRGFLTGFMQSMSLVCHHEKGHPLVMVFGGDNLRDGGLPVPIRLGC